jgi:hypothetical protein
MTVPSLLPSIHGYLFKPLSVVVTPVTLTRRKTVPMKQIKDKKKEQIPLSIPLGDCNRRHTTLAAHRARKCLPKDFSVSLSRC